MNPWELEDNFPTHEVREDGEIFIVEELHHCPEDSDGCDVDKLISLSPA